MTDTTVSYFRSTSTTAFVRSRSVLRSSSPRVVSCYGQNSPHNVVKHIFIREGLSFWGIGHSNSSAFLNTEHTTAPPSSLQDSDSGTIFRTREARVRYRGHRPTGSCPVDLRCIRCLRRADALPTRNSGQTSLRGLPV